MPASQAKVPAIEVEVFDLGGVLVAAEPLCARFLQNGLAVLLAPSSILVSGTSRQRYAHSV
jgi:hypothetical protein